MSKAKNVGIYFELFKPRYRTCLYQLSNTNDYWLKQTGKREGELQPSISFTLGYAAGVDSRPIRGGKKKKLLIGPGFFSLLSFPVSFSLSTSVRSLFSFFFHGLVYFFFIVGGATRDRGPRQSLRSPIAEQRRKNEEKRQNLPCVRDTEPVSPCPSFSPAAESCAGMKTFATPPALPSQSPPPPPHVTRRSRFSANGCARAPGACAHRAPQRRGRCRRGWTRRKSASRPSVGNERAASAAETNRHGTQNRYRSEHKTVDRQRERERQ